MQSLMHFVSRMLYEPFLVYLIFFGCLLPVSRAATLTWDANGTTSPNPSDGSGNWLTSNSWWNSSAGVNSNGNWTATTPNSAVFGAGTADAYIIDLGGNSLYASNVTFNTSGYLLTNGMITLSANSGINVVANQTATVNATVYGANNSQTWNINGNAALNMSGNVQGMQVMWQGGGTLNLNGINTPSIFWANTTVNQTSGSVTPGAYSFIGYSGGPGIYTLNGASASLNVNGGVLTIARAGQSGTLTIQNGTVNVGTTAVQSLNLALDNNNNNSATVNVQGGTLNVGAPGIPSLIQLMPGGSSSAESAALNISGGTVNAQGIQFGSANAYSGGTARLTLTNGALYVGSSGILKGVNIPGTSIITLSGGLVGASANWSSAMPMTLATANGNITFQAADLLNAPQNITLSGSLSGNGGLNKTGGGTLTLSGVNSYSGSTTNYAGILAVTTAGSGAR